MIFIPKLWLAALIFAKLSLAAPQHINNKKLTFRNVSTIVSPSAVPAKVSSAQLWTSVSADSQVTLSAQNPSTSPSPAPKDPNFESLLTKFNGTNGTSPTPSPSGSGKEYVVIFDPDHPTPLAVTEILQRVGMNGSSDVNYVFDNSAFRGFAGMMKGDHVEALNEMKEVKFVEASIKISSSTIQTRPNSPWGLQRLSQQGKVVGDPSKMNFQYRYDDVGNLAAGVDIYILDTGINIAHSAFGGRARMGFSKDGNNDLNAESDQEGHGTHVAGTAAANVFGVASAANLIGVKVLGADGTGLSSDTIKGLDYVVRMHDANKNNPNFVGSIASMSWGLDSRSTSVEQAINAAIDAGVHVSVAAGNQGRDACQSSPASAGGKGADGKGGKAVTVGSINSQDQISSFSNTGPCVDIYAPGEYIISTWIKGTNTVQALSGTSMACPHVTGLMAYLMAQNATLAGCPALMKQFLASSAFASQITAAKQPGDLGLLASNGIKSAGKQEATPPQTSRRDLEPVPLKW